MRWRIAMIAAASCRRQLNSVYPSTLDILPQKPHEAAAIGI
jgi:hypothetical protein